MHKFILFIPLFFLFCCTKQSPIKKSNYDHLTLTEKDSISERFNKISNFYRQPGQLHRTYKDSAVLVSPDNIGYRQVLSYSYKKRGEHLEAMKILNEAVRRDILNNSTDALEYRAWSLLYYYRDYEGAIRDIETIERMSGQIYNVCWGEPCGFQKGQAYYQLSQFDNAIEAFNTVNIEEKKLGFDIAQNYYLFYYLGRAYHRKKEYKDAIRFYNKVLEIDNEFSEAIFYIGKAYIDDDSINLAIPFIEEAYKLIKKDKKISEPYIERFDELFQYMVEEQLQIIKASQQ